MSDLPDSGPGFTTLPPEILEMIYGKCQSKDAMLLRQTCHKFDNAYKLCEDKLPIVSTKKLKVALDFRRMIMTIKSSKGSWTLKNGRVKQIWRILSHCEELTVENLAIMRSNAAGTFMEKIQQSALRKVEITLQKTDTIEELYNLTSCFPRGTLKTVLLQRGVLTNGQVPDLSKFSNITVYDHISGAELQRQLENPITDATFFCNDVIPLRVYLDEWQNDTRDINSWHLWFNGEFQFDLEVYESLDRNRFRESICVQIFKVLMFTKVSIQKFH